MVGFSQLLWRTAGQSVALVARLVSVPPLGFFNFGAFVIKPSGGTITLRKLP
jgi:hypothetical protein